MVRATYRRELIWIVAALFAGSLTLGCGDDDLSRVTVKLHGWIGDANDGQFVDALPEYPGAQQIRVKVTQPGERVVLAEETYSIFARQATLPEVPGGQGLRMDFEVLDHSGIIASGATPLFDMDDTPRYHGFRAMIVPINSFAPVASRVLSAETNEERLAQSRLHDWARNNAPLGRIGHEAHPTASGQVLVVGGGRVGSFHQPASTPNLQSVHGDIQLFNPATGYFTDLAGDEGSHREGVLGADVLSEARAFHTVTPLGRDRFLVVGGYSMQSGSATASNSIEVIDLRASPGNRVQTLNDLSGQPVTLQQGRAMHTATRLNDGRVVVIGGRGSASGDIIDTFEIIHPTAQNAIVEAAVPMSQGRVGHTAVLLGDGQRIWVMGGRNQESVLASTELLAPSAQGGFASSATVDMSRGRYGAVARFLGPGGNNFVVIFGGFTGLSSGATADYEFGSPDRGSMGEFISQGSWRLHQARGDAQLFELPQSGDLIIIGGLNPDLEVVPTVERMSFQGVQAPIPFSIDDPVGTMYQRRSGFAAAPVANGMYLLVGGQDSSQLARDDAEYFNPRDPVIMR